MKQSMDPGSGAVVAVTGGFVGALLQLWQQSAYVDSAGFLDSWSLPEILTAALTAVVILLLLIGSFRCPKKTDYETSFPAFFPGAVGCFAAAAGILVTLFTTPAKKDALQSITYLLGWASVVSLAALSGYRFLGKRPFFLFPAILTLYFLLSMISQYRVWSAVPQLQNYLYPLLALLAITLAVFHRAALVTDSGGFRSYLFYSRIALYFTCLALVCVHGTRYLFYLAMAVWLLTDAGWFREAG